TATNQPFTSHAWAAPGNYTVVLLAYNQSQPGGISATATVHVVAQPIHYVAADNANPVLPYSSWATAATNIQDAVDAATVPGALVLVTNGLYATGGRAIADTSSTNRVTLDKPLTLRSVNGPQETIINGGGSVRCAYLITGTTLSGFTLTNGVSGVYCESEATLVSNCFATGNLGEGAYGGTLNNCVLSSNSGDGASSSTLNNCTLNGNWGNGAYQCTLKNCALIGNSRAAYGGTLNNCTLTGNSAGGAFASTLNNCISYFNV